MFRYLFNKTNGLKCFYLLQGVIFHFHFHKLVDLWVRSFIKKG